jgi:hypothetical protein
MKKHQGTCHCGKVTFEYASAFPPVECNCSICRRKGAIWQAVDNEHFKILSGLDDLQLYQFGTKTAKHFFCKNCGVSTFSNPRLAPDKWSVNLRCVDDVDLSSLRVVSFDGQNWEQSAQAFLKALRSGAVQQADLVVRPKTDSG